MKAFFVHFPFHTRIRQESLQLRSKEESLPCEGIVEGLDAQAVAAEEEQILSGIVHGEGEDAVKLFGAFLPPEGVGPQDGFGIRSGLDVDPRKRKLSVQLLPVVDLAVVDHGIPMISVGDGHRLGAVGRVDDGQAVMAEGEAPMVVEAVLVGASAVHGGIHCPNCRFIVIAEDAADRTHSQIIPFP